MNNWDWQIVSEDYLKRTIQRCRKNSIILPTFEEQKNPLSISQNIQKQLSSIELHEVHPLNLFRIHWCNDPERKKIGGINYLEIPSELTGVPARIIGLVGKFFPTGAHKVGATYGCLVPYLISGRFNPDFHKAVWPSTGNYCRGGVFNSAILGVHAVAILPEEMSQERFQWLRERGAEVIATPGCESNVKEIYDKCHELEAQSDEYLVFNQFDQFGNAIWHYEITGPTLEKLYYDLRVENQHLTGFISATGSAGTIAAGDYLKDKFHHCKILASEALQCPTLLMNGFGGHRIEGIGDKHVPWIHNVKSLDAVCAIHDEDPLRILRLFNDPGGHQWLKSLGLSSGLISKLPWLGLSSIANLLSSIKLAKYYELTKNDILFTIFTDSAELYHSRLQEMNRDWGPYSDRQAEIDWHSVILRQTIDYFKELSYYDKKSIHHLKYFTWVEQQGKDVEELNVQWYNEKYWAERFHIVPQWNQLIEEFNQAVGL